MVESPVPPPPSARRATRAAIVLAAGHDAASRDLLTRPLGDSTVAQLALANVRALVPADRIVVVVAPGETTLRDLLGEPGEAVDDDAVDRADRPG